jgi:hypothetical protein
MGKLEVKRPLRRPGDITGIDGFLCSKDEDTVGRSKAVRITNNRRPVVNAAVNLTVS